MELLTTEVIVLEIACAMARFLSPSNRSFCLVAAGQRLLTVITRNKGGANKDLSKFADQINSLCDKWDR